MSAVAATRPPSLAKIYLRAAMGAVMKKHSLSPAMTRLDLAGIPPENLPLTLNRLHVRQFRRVVDDNVSANLQSKIHEMAPLTYLQCLLNCLPMNQLTHPHFPFNIVGSVHESIVLTRHHPIPHDATVIPLQAHCHLEPEIQRSDKDDGIFTIVTRVTDPSHHPEEDHRPPLPLMTITNKYRILNPQRHKIQKPTDTDTDTNRQELLAATDYGSTDSDWQQLAQWNFGVDAGRQYAALNGDINPIHMHPLSAKLFGYQSCIAHGMYSVCKLWSVVETLPMFQETTGWDDDDDDPEVPPEITLSARFLRPTLLPNPKVVAFWKSTTSSHASDGGVPTRSHLEKVDGNQGFEYVIGTRHQQKDDTFKETVKGSIEIVRHRSD